jgi:hypothetical protein
MATALNPKVQQGMDLVDNMTDEELNNFVDYIRYALKDRSARRNAKAKALVSVGDRVRLAGKYKPAYLMGLTGVITEKRQTRVVVKLDRGPVGKFKSGTVITTPAGLEII